VFVTNKCKLARRATAVTLGSWEDNRGPGTK